MNQTTKSRAFLHDAPWRLWTAQLAAVLSIELKKNLFRRRSLWIYFVAFAPVLLIGGLAIYSPGIAHGNLEGDTITLARTFEVYYLRLGLFFGCLGLFTWLFRGEIVEKSLHYYFLSPVRREVLVAGKFLAGVITSASLFSVSVLLFFSITYGQFGRAGRSFVFAGPGLGHLFAYLGTTVLACLGYGAVFLALSLIAKNPVLPGILVLLWEIFHPVFPAMLQKLSITFYLKQLCPVTIPPEGLMALFTVVAEPVSPWIAVPGLVALSMAVLVFASFRIRRMEISYLAD
ncbi:MAG TPA: ABC transporter permease [Candidatus Saccharimonadales bacterium]|jgi:ABC-type transport system involved in multi-copper enzyme maturation permease subunit|nr:ABC transporter permease [Candidatus Saccharimonadales bacterium]